MKGKIDFYIAFYSSLTQYGFQSYVSFTAGHIADICVDNDNIAHLTTEDTIIENPYAEKENGVIDRLRTILKETAEAFTVCKEKPYDEAVHEKMPDGSYKLAECNGVILTASSHTLLHYVFTVQKRFEEKSRTFWQDQFLDKDSAWKEFSIRSGIDSQIQLFQDYELHVIFKSLVHLKMIKGSELTESRDIEALIAKIAEVLPVPAYDSVQENTQENWFDSPDEEAEI